MAHKKGTPKTEGSGRKKGSVNKSTIAGNALKSIIISIVNGEYESGRVENALLTLYEQDKYKYMSAIDKLQDKVIVKESKVTAEVDNSADKLKSLLANVE